MSGLDPSGPSQPNLDQAYTTPGNPAGQNPSEARQSSAQAHDNSAPVDHRIPRTQASEGTASSLGRGVRGVPAGEEGKGLTDEDVGRHNELDGEQMAAPGEGRIASAVKGAESTGKDALNLGGSGEQPDFAADLDRKKAEQKEARDAMKQHKGEGQAAGGALGQQGGPANPVDNPNVGGGNYPNA